MADDDEEVVSCDAGALAADASAVDALARLQLCARRQGYRVQLEGASDELLQLLAFAGLADVFALDARRLAKGELFE